MSELVEIDTTLGVLDEEVKLTPDSEAPLLEEPSNNKRRLSDEGDEQLDGDDNDEDEAVRSSRKKFCTENDTLTAGNEQDVRKS